MIEDTLVTIFSVLLIIVYAVIFTGVLVCMATITYFAFSVNPLLGFLVGGASSILVYLLIIVLVKEYKDDI